HQLGMPEEEIHHLRSRDVVLGSQPELAESLVVAHELGGRPAEKVQDALEGGPVGRMLEILDDLAVDAALAQDLERAARLPAHGMVVEGGGGGGAHRWSVVLRTGVEVHPAGGGGACHPRRAPVGRDGMRRLLDLVELGDVVDILLVTVLVYTAVVWIRRTQAGFVAIGLFLLAALYVRAEAFDLQPTTANFRHFFRISAV